MSSLILPVWKVVTVGVCQSVRALRRAAEEEDISFSGWRNLTLATKERVVELFRCRVAELGSAEPNEFGDVRFRDILGRLDVEGYGECSLETLVQLRRVYPEQPMEEYPTVITRRIATGSPGRIKVYYLKRSPEGLLINQYYSSLDDRLSADEVVVFCRKPKREGRRACFFSGFH